MRHKSDFFCDIAAKETNNLRNSKVHILIPHSSSQTCDIW